jgi:hypothetical protein
VPGPCNAEARLPANPRRPRPGRSGADVGDAIDQHRRLPPRRSASSRAGPRSPIGERTPISSQSDAVAPPGIVETQHC